jgi:phospholipid/cholesterol/gamma-HCH transport system substrate-binding protein
MAELEIKPTPRQRLRVLSILLIAIAFSLFLMYLLVGGGSDLIASRTDLTTYMPDAGGLSLQSQVRLSGIRIGTVDKIELSGILDPRRAVRVEMRVLTRYLRSIPEDSQTDITADTLVGYAFVDIAEGKSPVPIKQDGVLLSEPVKEAQDRADLIKTIRDELTQVDQIFATLEDPTSPVGAFIHGEKEYDAAVDRVRGFDESLHSFLNPQSDLGKAFYTDKFYEQLRGKAAAFDKTLASMEAGEGSVGHLYASDEGYNNLVRELADLRAAIADLNAGKGSLGATLRDDGAWIKARQLLRQIDQTVAALNMGQGTTGRLLSNAQLYESLNGSLRSMEALLHDLRENPRKYLRLKPF